MKFFVDLESQLEILNPILKEMEECASKNLKLIAI